MPDLAAALEDAKAAAGLADNLTTARVSASALHFAVAEQAPGDDRVGPQPRMALVRAIAQRIEDRGGEVTAGPRLARYGDGATLAAAGIYSVLGRWNGRDITVTASMSFDDLALIDEEMV